MPQLVRKEISKTRNKKILKEGNNQILAQSELEEKISIANSDYPGSLASLPDLPDEWIFTDELWEQVIKNQLTTQSINIKINDWVRKGLNMHKAGESCQFCGSEISEKRIQELQEEISQIDSEAPTLVKDQLKECGKTLSGFQVFKRKLEDIDPSTSIYGSSLPPKVDKILVLTGDILDELNSSAQILTNRIKNSYIPSNKEKPNIPFQKLAEHFKDLKKEHGEANNKITLHTQNKENAIIQLKKHCCATDGTSWKELNHKYEISQTEVETAKNAELTAKDTLDELKRQVSTTASTADFLDKKLSQILGDATLQVSEGSSGEGYVITRNNEKAEKMSEGEKKLVSLLYFCAEFLAEDRKKSLANSVVIFGDPGSELDEPRLFALDRFITKHFERLKPASLVYLTHNNTYMKILQSRLGDKAAPRNKKDTPKAVFYEVYKNLFGSSKQTTNCRQWDDEEIRLINDYWLSFYIVLKAYEKIENNESPELGSGNACRKVLEGFTEFIEPGIGNFGSRIDAIVARHDYQLQPSLSKLLNHLSHSALDRAGGVLSRHEITSAVSQTLNFIRFVNGEHFNKLVTKFRDKDEAKRIEEKLQKLTNNYQNFESRSPR